MRRLFLLLITAVLSLGCMGTINGLTGLDMDMQFAEKAVHPSDFAVRPPEGGEKVMSMGMTADADTVDLPVEVDLTTFEKVRMDMISYGIADPDAALKTAVGHLEEAGYSVAPSEEANVKVYRKDGTLFVIAIGDEGQDKTINLIRLEPRPAGTASETPAEAPAE